MPNLDPYADIEADEFGIRDGRDIAQRTVTEALRLVLPYVGADAKNAMYIMYAMLSRAFNELADEMDREGRPAYSIAYEEDKLKDRDLREAFVAHAEATKDITAELIEQGEAVFSEASPLN